MATGQPLRTSLLLTGDSSDLKAAAVEARREVAGVGETARQASGDLGLLAGANDAAAAAARRAADAVRGQSAAETDLRAAISSFAGIRPDRGGADIRARQADIDAYAASLDRLRAKYNPVFAASKAYEAELDELNRAHALGAINAQEHGAALEVLNARYQLGAADATRFGASTRVSAAHAGNLAAQLNDIGVMLAAGQSPFQLMLQQGTQINQIWGHMGAGGVLATFRTALMSMVNPISLVTFGVIGAGAAAVQYFTRAGEEAIALDGILDRHEQIIRSLGPAYENALQKAREYSKDPIVAEAVLSDNAREAAEKLAEETAKVIDDLNSAVDTAIRDALGKSAHSVAEAISESRFAPFYEVIELFRQGTIDAREFELRVSEIGASADGFRKAAEELRSFANAAVEAMGNVEGLPTEINDVALAFGQSQAAIDKIRSDNARDELSDLVEQAEEGELSIDEVRTAIGNLSGVSPDLSNAIAELVALFEQAIATRDAVEDVMRGGGTGGPRRYSRGVNTRIDRYEVDLPDEAPAPQRRVDPYFEAPTRARGRRGKSDAERDRERYRDIIRSAEQYIELQALEREALYLTEEAAAALRYEQNLLNQAQNAGIELTPDQTAALSELAQEMARVEAETDAAAEAMAHQRDIMDGALSDLRSALDDGKLTWEELASVALNAIDKIIDKIQDELLDALLEVGNAGRGSGGGFGGILGWLAGIFDFGGVSLPNSAPIPMPRPPGFASGVDHAPPGWAWVGEEGPELIRLRGGETIRSHTESVRMVGGGMRAPQALASPSLTNSPTTVRLVMPEGWRAEIVGEARRGAQRDTVQIVEEYDRGMPDRLQAISGDPRAR